MINKEFFLSFKKQYRDDNVVITAIVFIISFFQWLMLDLSSFIGFNSDKILFYGLLGIFIMFLIDIFFIIIFNKTKLAVTIASILVLILTIVNFLVFSCRGIPFVFSHVFNVKTAFDVTKNIDISEYLLAPRYLLFLFLFIIQIVFINFPSKNHAFNLKYKIQMLLFVSVFVCFYFVPFNSLAVPTDPIRHSFEDGIKQYGYLTCLIRQAGLDIMPISHSDNYNEENTLLYLASQSGDKTSYSGDYPDIILIVNEAFYDLSQIYTLNNNDYLKHFYSIENAIYGYCVVPGFRAGTNLTEYEILTGNSMLPLSNITPFNTLKFENANSFLFHFRNLGYNTISMHPKNKKNYNRFSIYPKIGFDVSYFEEDFINLEFWDERKEATLDKSLYQNMINWYNKMDNSPKFIYALTMQNHWPYNQVSDENLITNYENSFSKYNHAVNEYLSSITLSDEAFSELINYYKASNKNVIICMLGDHAPYIKEAYEINTEDDEFNLKVMSTPFIIWSNNPSLLKSKYKSDILGETRISAIYLIPTILESAQMPLSEYQKLLIEMRNDMPVINSYGIIYDNEGKKYNLTDLKNSNIDNEQILYQKLCEYIDIEYINITKPSLVKDFCN